MMTKNSAVITRSTCGRASLPHIGWWEGRGPMGSAENDLDDEASWQADANCLGVDPDLFFPERGASTKEAKAVCRGCQVREDCLEYALANGEKFGIWGGLSERDRRRHRRARRQEAA